MDQMIDIDLTELGEKAEELEAKRANNEMHGIPFIRYDQFVNNLFKPMPSSRDMVHHACTGISGEAGELLDASKKAWVYGKAYNLENIIEELGDIRYYYQAMLNMLGVSDGDIVAHNTFKLRQRYPDLVYKDQDAIARADKENE